MVDMEEPMEDWDEAWRIALGILSMSRGRKEDVAASLLEHLEGRYQHGPQLLRKVAEIYKDAHSNEDEFVPAVFTEEILTELKSRFAESVDAFLSSKVRENPPEDSFYDDLWAFIHNPLFRTKQEKAFVFYWILIDPKVPYYKLPMGLRMSNDDYRRTLDLLRTEANKILLALYRDFEQRTERADILLKIILGRDDQEERAVLMSWLIAAARLQGEMDKD